MPDNETVVSTSPTQDTIQQTQDTAPQVDVAAFIAEGMRNNGLVPQDATQAPVNIQGQVQDVAPQPVLIPLDTFKEFGYENPETIVNDIKEYRALKAAPPKVEPIKFENEESEKLFRAWQGGKKDEVYNYLAEQKRLEQYTNAEVDDRSADDILKLEMQLKYKSQDVELSKDDINRMFNRQYAIPKEPLQVLGETDADFEERVSEWKAQIEDIKAEKILNAKIAKPTLVAAKANLKFPELNNTVDEGYKQYQENLKLGEQIEAEDREAYKTFTPKSIETKAKYIDEANGINFEFQFEPDVESFNQAKEMASDINLFFKSFIGQDGKPNRQDFLDAIYFSKNKQKVITEAIRQGSTARMKSILPDNTTGGLIKQFAPAGQEPSEFQKNMDRALGAWQPKTRVS